MDYIIIGLLVLSIILVLIILLRNNGSNDMTERLGRFESNITKDIADFNVNFSRDLREDFEKSKL